MEILAWITFVALAIIGLVGAVFPGVPGLPLVVIGAVIHKLALPNYLSWWSIGAIGVLCLLSFVVEWVGTVYGAKKWGKASQAGLIGAAIGGLIGIFFMPFGLILGPALGAFVGELVSYRSIQEAVQSAFGTGIGLGVSVVFRAGLALTCLVILIVDLVF